MPDRNDHNGFGGYIELGRKRNKTVMKNKEFYDLKKIECIVSHKINGCGKAIPNKLLITVLYDGKRISVKKETEKTVYRFLLDWAEEEKK